MPKPSKTTYSSTSDVPYAPNVLHPENCLNYPHDFHDDELIVYLLQNFGFNLGITEIHYENLHHFADALLAYRSLFKVLKITELVQKMDDFLSRITNQIRSLQKLPPIEQINSTSPDALKRAEKMQHYISKQTKVQRSKFRADQKSHHIAPCDRSTPISANLTNICRRSITQ